MATSAVGACAARWHTHSALRPKKRWISPYELGIHTFQPDRFTGAVQTPNHRRHQNAGASLACRRSKAIVIDTFLIGIEDYATTETTTYQHQQLSPHLTAGTDLPTSLPEPRQPATVGGNGADTWLANRLARVQPSWRKIHASHGRR